MKNAHGFAWSELPLTQLTQLCSGVSDEERSFYNPVCALSFVFDHMIVTSKDQNQMRKPEE